MNIYYNKKCYNIEKKEYKIGLFDSSIDATYIIHLENNGRLESIYNQLKQYIPTKIVYIFFNKGYKKCNKKLLKNITYHDLNDSYLQIFNHANKHNYDNILILEDDFIFNKEIKKKENIDSINKFLIEKKDEEFIYYLGCLPFIIFFYSMDLKHYFSIISSGSHSVIYSKKSRLIEYDLSLDHWDRIIEKQVKNRYLYYIPLCYQTYPLTDNRKQWNDNIFSVYVYITEIDKNPEPGFSINYYFSKFLIIFILLLIIIACIYILKNGNGKGNGKGKGKGKGKR
jgi:hypothetical protein